MKKMQKRLRIVLAKTGLDGHDRGINVIKDALIEEGCEVFYFGLFRNFNDIAEIAVQEGADFIGLSVHSGAHKKYVQQVFEHLKKHNALDINLILGGIIPEKDEKFLREKFNVRKIFVSGTPETNLNDIKTFFHESLGRTITCITALKTKNDAGFAISAISNGLKMEKLKGNWPGKNALILGVTGAMGVGKSTLIDKLIAEFRTLNKKIGVITIDPSDHVSGGALLGRDRTQMWRHLYDPDVYIYSMATRGYQGGIAESTSEAAEIMKMAGYDVILIETIGVGQDQTAIKNIVDKVILVLTPDIGEDQIYKSGIMQIADYYIINKSDICDASPLEKHIENMLDQKKFHTRRPKILKISAKLKNNVVIKWLAEILSSDC